MIEHYYLKRNLSERFNNKKPSKELARTLLAEKSFCGGGIMSVEENTMTQEEIEQIAYEYAKNSAKFENDTTKNFRIRKLTPKECWRLMGVKDEDFEKVAKNQSNSSLYHLAGDSIITTCLMGLFGQMLDVDWEEKVKETLGELK